MIPHPLPDDVHHASVCRTTEFGRPALMYAVHLESAFSQCGANWCKIGTTFEAAYAAAQAEQERLDADLQMLLAA